MDFDHALELLGGRSLWKIGLFCLNSFFGGLLSGWHMLSFVFVALAPNYHCQLPEGLLINESVPEVIKDGVSEPDKCHTWFNYSRATNTTTTCPNGWWYEPPIHSIVNEWDLVCGKSVMVETSETFLIAGLIPGALVMTALSDWFGRKQVFIMALLALSLAGLLTSFTQSYLAFAIGRLFTGFFQQGTALVGYVHLIELFPASQRTVVGTIAQIMWAVSMVTLAGIAWISPNWRHILRSISLPGFLGIILIWVMPESLSWLTAKDRTSQAKHVLETAAKVSRVTLPSQFQLNEDEVTQLKEDDDKDPMYEIKECLLGCHRKRETKNKKASQYSLLDVVRSRKLLTYTLINVFLWCSNTFIYYGLSLSTGSLAGNPYINFCLSGLVEVPAYLVSAFVLKTLGRRWSIFGFHIIAGIPLFLTLFIPEITDIVALLYLVANGTDLRALIVTLSMIGKFGITGSFASLFLYTPELYPTTVRNAAFGALAVVSRIGHFVAPFSGYVAKHMWWLPNVVFGVMALVAAVLTLVLPETLNRPLPETIEEIEGFSRTLCWEGKLCHEAKKKTELEMKNKFDADDNEKVLEGLLNTRSVADAS